MNINKEGLVILTKSIDDIVGPRHRMTCEDKLFYIQVDDKTDEAHIFLGLYTYMVTCVNVEDAYDRIPKLVFGAKMEDIINE